MYLPGVLAYVKVVGFSLLLALLVLVVPLDHMLIVLLPVRCYSHTFP